MSLVGLIKGTRGASGFGYASTAEQVTEGLDLTGKTALVTGVNSGIGFETARVLGLRGAHIIGVARSEKKAEDACARIGDNTSPVVCELSDLRSAQACAQAVKALDRPIDMLICNAGIMALSRLQQKHGIELQFFTNHIGHFVLVTGLLDALAPDGRVVTLSSYGHTMAPREGIQFDNLSGEAGYSKWRAYGQSKLANILFALGLTRRFNGSRQTANAVHPGVIRTNLTRHMGGFTNTMFALTGPLFAKSAAQGAATTCYVATHPSLADVSGKYFADCNETKTSAHGRDEAMAEKLWEVSEQIVERVLAEA